MPGEIVNGAQPPVNPAQAMPGQPRAVSEQDKKLSADWLKRIEDALSRPCIKDSFKQFEKNRKLLRGRVGEGEEHKRIRSNLYFANLAMMRPQIYAKDPEFSVSPTKAVPAQDLDLVRKFGATAEAVLGQVLVNDCKLKKRAKRLITGAYTTSIGWWKLCWQEDIKRDPIIQNQMDDTQANIQRLEQLRQDIDNPESAGTDAELKLAQLRETLAGLQSQSEVVVSRGPVLDFVLSEDIVVLDASVRELGDYERSGSIAHRVWFTREAYKKAFGSEPQKGKTYREQAGQMAASSTKGSSSDLFCVWEVWDKETNRVYTVCDGEEGFCKEPFSPDWTGQRWYPFFALAWNEIDGTFYPLSDVELIEPLVTEYNESRDDFVKDRRACLPLNIVRKGGALTDTDIKSITNRQGGDVIMVEGVGGQAISNDIWSGQLGQLDPKNYDTSAARGDIEQIIGGGDASRGSVLAAKTATEAEILSQGLRGRSAERQDTLEDMLSEIGSYTLEMCLRKLTAEEVKKMTGPESVWPQLTAEQVFQQVSVKVRAGSTGRPDRLQEQDRWTKLQPVIKETVMTVAELYSKGQVKLGQALAEMLRETLRRFDERIDLEQYLPKAPEEGEADPAMMQQQIEQLKMQLKEAAAELEKAHEDSEKGYLTAATSLATSPNPPLAVQAFMLALQAIRTGENTEKTLEGGEEDGATENQGAQTPELQPEPI